MVSYYLSICVSSVFIQKSYMVRIAEIAFEGKLGVLVNRCE